MTTNRLAVSVTLLAPAIAFLLPTLIGCCPSLNRSGVTVEVVVDPDVSAARGQHFEVWADEHGGWRAQCVVPSTTILMERTELWFSQDSTGVHARARVSRYEESNTVSGVERDELRSLHGTISVSAPGVPTGGEHRFVSYSLDGQREHEAIRRTGCFEFSALDFRR